MLGVSKKRSERTALIVDIETGSVASALAHLSPNVAPKLFGEKRVFLPVSASRSSHELLQSIERSLEKVLRHSADLAARLRAKTQNAGEVTSASLFLSAPWGTFDLAAGDPKLVTPAAERMKRLTEAYFGPVPIRLNTGAGAMAYAKRALLPHDADVLLVSVGGEVSELVLIKGGKVLGYATLPHGIHNALRTLRTHALLSEHEARSALKERTTYPEAHDAAAEHFVRTFIEGAAPLLAGSDVRRVFVASRGNSDWFARALSQSPSLEELFPQGGVVRALTPRYATALFSGHALEPDLMLMLGALFVSGSV